MSRTQAFPDHIACVARFCVALVTQIYRVAQSVALVVLNVRNPLEHEVCDFPVIDPNNPTDTNNTVLDNFEHDGCALNQIQVNNTCVFCSNNAISIDNACVTCPGNQVADPGTNSCLDCPPGQVNVSGTCTACPADRISQGNTCVVCAVGKGPNRDTNTCDDCPNDFVIDGGQLQASAGSVTVQQSQHQAPNDFCPTQLWISVVNTSPAGLNFDVSSALENDLTGAACSSSEASEVVLEQGMVIADDSSAGLTCAFGGDLDTCNRNCEYPQANDSVLASAIPDGVFRIGANGNGAPISVTVTALGAPK